MPGDILTDLSATALAYAAKANLHECLRYLGGATQTPPTGDAGITRWHTQVAYAWFNGVLAERPVANGDEITVQDMIAWFQARGVTSFTWWLEPSLPGAEWANLLRAHGFHASDGPPGMAVDLDKLNESGKIPPGFQIVPVTDAQTLRVWTHTFIIGYELPPAWETSLWQMMSALGLELPIRNYLGYLDGRPVATSNLFLGAGVAGIQCVATLPDARGKGLGGAITLAPLREAREMGYRAGILQSSELGFSVYRRLGFEQVCQVEHFYWGG